MVEKATGDVSAAREAFAEALRRNARCAPSLRQWAVLEMEEAQRCSGRAAEKQAAAKELWRKVAEEEAEVSSPCLRQHGCSGCLLG
jgi:hypothetical protein